MFTQLTKKICIICRKSKAKQRREARRIFNEYLNEKSDRCIHLSPHVVQDIRKHLKRPSHSLFQAAMLEVGCLLQSHFIDYVNETKLKGPLDFVRKDIIS